MQKIIFISPQNIFNPSSGVESRVNNLIKYFSKQNILYIFAPKQDVEIPFKNYFGYNCKNRINKLYNKELITMASKFKDADYVLATTIWAGLNGWLISRKINKPFYFDDHNVEFLRFKRTKSILWPFIFLFEWFLCRKATKIFCVSEVDKLYLVKYYKLNPNKIEVFENPVDKHIFYPNRKVVYKIRNQIGIKKDEKFILFFGQLDYMPNVQGIKIIINEIIPRLEKMNKKYKIVICGKGDGKGLLKKFKHKNLIFEGFVNNINDYINACDVVIVPLVSGSGTRIKILEALACKKKVVSTSIGAEGIKKNKYLKIEDKMEKFVEKI